MGSPRTFPPAGLSSGPLAGNSQPLLCQGAADDVIPPPQARCGEHGCSLGVQSSRGMRDHPHPEQGPPGLGRASRKACLGAPCRDQAALLLEPLKGRAGSQS